MQCSKQAERIPTLEPYQNVKCKEKKTVGSKETRQIVDSHMQVKLRSHGCIYASRVQQHQKYCIRKHKFPDGNSKDFCGQIKPFPVEFRKLCTRSAKNVESNIKTTTHWRKLAATEWREKTDRTCLSCTVFWRELFNAEHGQLMDRNVSFWRQFPIVWISVFKPNVTPACGWLTQLRQECISERPRSMQAVDLGSQRRHVIGSRRPVAEPSANAPQPMNESMIHGISTRSLHVSQQYNHLPVQQCIHTISICLPQYTATVITSGILAETLQREDIYSGKTF